MDTNLNIPPQKKIVSVEILHLDELGYGPQGKHTRREWRKECLLNFKAGHAAFKEWQESWLSDEKSTHDFAKFECILNYDDGSKIKPLRIPGPGSTLDFVGHTFVGNIYATGHEFLQLTDFYYATFKGDVNFHRVNFLKFINFDNALFEKYVKFNNTIFEGDADFSNSTFNDNASFSNAVFVSVAFFSNVTFNAGAAFIKTVFKSLSLFHENGSMNIQGTVFKKQASFESAVFNSIGHFEGVRFDTQIPNFIGVANESTRLEFSDDDYFTKTDISEDAIKRLSMLKRLADQHGQTDQSLMFNAFELNAKREQARINTESLIFFRKLGDSNFWFANATYLYDKFSDYGRSFTRPLIGYLILLFITFYLAIANAIFFSARECENEKWYLFTNLWRKQITCTFDKDSTNKTLLTAYRAAGEYTIYRAAGILDFSDNGKGTEAVAYRLFGQPIEPWWMRIWGVFKAIASTALLFLAALGLRNKYRIK
jgi:Pentapeptide repeats (9 copies)